MSDESLRYEDAWNIIQQDEIEIAKLKSRLAAAEKVVKAAEETLEPLRTAAHVVGIARTQGVYRGAMTPQILLELEGKLSDALNNNLIESEAGDV